MSVIMCMRLPVDPDRFEQVTLTNEQQLTGIVEQAKAAGVIHHAFCAHDGEVIVLDEWPDEQSFRGFFEANGDEIGAMFADAGLTTQPQPEVWRLLETTDRL